MIPLVNVSPVFHQILHGPQVTLVTSKMQGSGRLLILLVYVCSIRYQPSGGIMLLIKCWQTHYFISIMENSRGQSCLTKLLVNKVNKVFHTNQNY